MEIAQKEVKVGGRTVVVRPFRFFDLSAVTRVYDALQKTDDATEQFDLVAQLLALALRVGRDDFEAQFAAIEMAEVAALMDAVTEVNKDFFNRTPAPAAPPSRRGKS